MWLSTTEIGVASLCSVAKINEAEITVLMFEQKPYLIWFSCRCTSYDYSHEPREGGGTLGIFGCMVCAAETLEPLAYTRTSSAEFGYPILD